MRSLSYVRPIVWVMVVALAVALHSLFPPFQPIPADDGDLDRILAKIKPFEVMANQCAAEDCPEMECATAQKIQTKLRDARIVMRYTAYWMGRATDDQLRHLTNIAGESMEANARTTKVQKIMAYQQWVVGISSGMLEITSLSGNITEILDDPKLLKSKSYGEMASLVDKFYEGMKDEESLISRLRQGRNDRDFPQPVANMMPALEGLSSSEMNDLKSTLSDVKSLMEGAQKHGKDWRTVLSEGKGAAAIGQIAGRYLKAYADSQIAERKRLVDSLLNDVLAQDAVQSQAFKDFGRMQARRNKAEDAYLALDKLIVIAPGQGQMARCLLKVQRSCTGLDLNYASAYRLPADVEVADFRIINDEDRRKSWGNALLKINALLPTVENWLQYVPEFHPATSPSLQLNKFVFRAGEDMSVQANVPVCQKPSAWLGIIATGIPHGNEPQNALNVLSGKQEMSATATGALHFNAPQQPGRYDVRMSDAVSGKELASLSFQVGPASISGVWDSDLNLGPRIKKNPVRFIEDEDGIKWGGVYAEDTDKWIRFADETPNPKTGRREGNIIYTTSGGGCGTGAGGRKTGEIRNDIPAKLIISEDGKKMTLQSKKYKCRTDGTMIVTDEWETLWTYTKRP